MPKILENNRILCTEMYKKELKYTNSCGRLYVFGIGGVVAVRVLLTIIFILVCIALTVVVLAQQGKEAGLGSIGGMGDTYWSKNKGRSMEGKLVKYTKLLGVLFIVIAVILNLNF